jgi:5-methylcytosine-specific restriction enzyme subunit McrC
MLWVGEHGKIARGSESRSIGSGDLELRGRDFDALLSLLDETDDVTPDFEPVFKYAQQNGEPLLKVQNYVGVIRTESGAQIEVLPKIARRELSEGAQARKLLIKMLVELEDSPFKESTQADLSAHDMPLFELLLRYFMDQVVGIIRKGIARTYVPRQENLLFLRGKLQLTEHLKRNSFNSARCYCEYDEYEANRPVNRLIKSALEIASKLVSEPRNQQLARELLFWFEEVPSSTDFRLDFQRRQHDRNIQHYDRAMPLCRLILERLNPLTKEGEKRAVSMLFRMEKVFEDYVSAKLPLLYQGWAVSTQVQSRALIERHDGKRKFYLIPDLLMKKGGTTIVADTKWKLLDETDSEHNYGIAQSDVYQLFTYLKKYLGHQDHRLALLIYPKTESFGKPLADFWYRTGLSESEKLKVVPYDLENDRLLIDEEELYGNGAVALAG